MASRSTAAARVFSITELHENILSYLSPLDLLHAQRVGPAWLDNIRGSMIIQRIIYPESIDASTAWIFDFLPEGFLDKHLFGYCIKDVASMSDVKKRYSKNAYAYSSIFNELLLCRKYARTHQIASDVALRGEFLELTQQANKILFVHDEPLSCDNMLLVDVALHEVRVAVHCICGGPSSSSDCLNTRSSTLLRNQNGLQVKDLRKHVRKVCPRAQVCTINFPYTNASGYGMLFPDEAEAYWVKQNKNLDVKWSR